MAERWTARIRQATPEDLAAMEWEGECGCYRRLGQQAMRELFTARCGILLADAGGRVVGKVVVRFGGAPQQLDDGSDVGCLHALRVRPAFRRQGIGGRLITEAKNVLRPRRDRRMALAVARADTAARRPYGNRGYAVVVEDAGEWSCHDDEGHWRQVRGPAHVPEMAS